MPKSRRGKLRTEQPWQTANGEANSEGKDEVQGQLVKHSAGLPPTQVLTSQAQPWSQWFPGENGRWFYQGRLKADGSGWEYQFTEGYPPTTTRRSVGSAPYDSGAPRTTDTYGASEADPLTTVEQDKPVSADLTAENRVEDIGQADATALKPTSSVLPQEHHNQPESQVQLVTLSSIPPRVRGREKGLTGSRTSATSFQTGVGRKKKKKLDSIVKSEKELRFNPKRSVKKWLNNVEP